MEKPPVESIELQIEASHLQDLRLCFIKMLEK